MNDTVGIDISKATLDVFRRSDGRREQFSNDAAGLKKLRKWLGDTPARVIYEPTGPYHRDLEQSWRPQATAW